MVALYMVTGCSDDDDNGGTALHGQWHLVSVTSGWTGTVDEFERGIVTWTFNGDTGKVVANNASEEVYAGPDSGTYDFEEGPWENMCEQSLTIDDNNYGCLEFEGDEFTVSTSAVDGPILRFER